MLRWMVALFFFCSLWGDATNRFVLQNDLHAREIAETPIPPVSWWSRPYEYAWAAQFAGPEYVVLDAACGIPHPFKWLLGKLCKETWVCDIDPRIDSMPEILNAIRNDLGEVAYAGALKNIATLLKVKRVRASIADLPKSMPQFDRIFCISTFEHMSKGDQRKTFKEFARILKPEGLIVMTVDYPVVTPEALLGMASAAHLEPVGEVEWGPPPGQALYSAETALHIYRCVLRKEREGHD